MRKKGKDVVPRPVPAPAVDVAAGIGEVVLDSVLNEGVLRDVPALGSAVGLARAVGTMRDHYFLKKVAGFLGPFSDPRDRAEFATRIEADGKERAKVGENLVLLLERLDDMRKPEMIGRIYLAYIRGRIGWRDLQLLTAAVDRLHLIYAEDLIDMYQIGGSHPRDPLALQHLAYCGLLKVALGEAGTGGSYVKSDLGFLAVGLLFDVEGVD